MVAQSLSQGACILGVSKHPKKTLELGRSNQNGCHITKSSRVHRESSSIAIMP